jgi:hypothetical protein
MTGAALGNLDPLIDEAMEEWQVPGLALGWCATASRPC